MRKQMGYLPGLKRKIREPKIVDMHLDDIVPPPAGNKTNNDPCNHLTEDEDAYAIEVSGMLAHGICPDSIVIRGTMVRLLVRTRGEYLFEELNENLESIATFVDNDLIFYLKTVFSSQYLLEDDHETMSKLFSQYVKRHALLGKFPPHIQILPADTQISRKWHVLMHYYYLLIECSDSLYHDCLPLLIKNPSDTIARVYTQVYVQSMIAIQEFAKNIRNNLPDYNQIIAVYQHIPKGILSVDKTDKNNKYYVASQSLAALLEMMHLLSIHNINTLPDSPKMYPGEHTNYGQGSNTLQ